jgi:hypothetical protein
MKTINNIGPTDLQRAEALTLQHLGLCPLLNTFVKAVSVHLESHEITVVNTDKSFGLEDALATSENVIFENCTNCPFKDAHNAQAEAVSVVAKPWEYRADFHPAILIQTD